MRRNARRRTCSASSSATDTAKVLVKAAGTGLPDPTLGSVAVPVRVQVANLSTDVCWEGAFDGADLTANDADLLKAKATN